MDDPSKDNPLPREDDRRQYADRYHVWWCTECVSKTQWVELEDGSFECQSCGVTV